MSAVQGRAHIKDYLPKSALAPGPRCSISALLLTGPTVVQTGRVRQFRKIRIKTRLSTQISNRGCRETLVRRRAVGMSDRDATHSDLVDIAKQTRFQEELRRNCRSHSLPPLDKCCSAAIVLVASLDDKYRSCVGLLVAMNKSTARRDERRSARREGCSSLPELRQAKSP
jgi:hypothetical protein